MNFVLQWAFLGVRLVQYFGSLFVVVVWFGIDGLRLQMGFEVRL